MPALNPHRVLVLGGGYAGVTAAARVARGNPRARVTLIDARPSFTQRIRLHQLLAGETIATTGYGPLLARRGIRFQQGTIAALDLARNRVDGRSASGGRIIESFDSLVLALGSRTTAGVPGVERHAVRLDHPVAVRRAAERLAALGAGARVVVVGGGLSGIETAAEIAERHPRLGVTLTTSGTIGGPYAPAGEAHLRGRLAALGVDLVEADPVELVERGHVSLQSGRTLGSELCVWAGGFAASPLGWEAGLETAADGRILVDETLRVPGRPEIFVAGDSAAVRDGNGGFIRMGCVSAAPLGAHAGANLRRQLDGSSLEPFRFAFMLRCISLGRRDGLVQFTQDDDAPKPAVWTGRRAAATKELICAATFWAVKAEAGLGMPITWWPLGQAA